MIDTDKAAKALSILESCDVMHEFDDCLWVRVDREDWDELRGINHD